LRPDLVSGLVEARLIPRTIRVADRCHAQCRCAPSWCGNGPCTA